MGAHTASAANNTTIYVNTQGNDTWDGLSPIYNTTGSGPKLTILNATSTVTDNGTIYIANGTYNQTGDYNININKNMTLIGASQQNTIINANNQAQIFTIPTGVNVTIQDLTLTNGKAPDGTSGSSGGNGGAINNSGTLKIINVTLLNNQAGNGGSVTSGGTAGDGGSGGAIYNSGTLTITNTTMSNNQAGGGGYGGGDYYHAAYGGNGGSGGAIYNSGILTITNTILSSNQAGDAGADNSQTGASGGNGGAIYNSGNLTVTNTTLSSNQAGNGSYGQSGGSGGAIFNSGNLTVTNTTLSSNQAGRGGSSSNQAGGSGGSGGAISNSGTLTVTNTTLSSNQAGNGDYGSDYGGSGGSGGAISNSGTLTVTNTTLSSNQAGNGGSSYAYGGSGGSGGAISNSGNLTVTNTTLSSNQPGNGGSGSTTGGSGSGGAIYIYNGTLTLNNSTLTLNNATNGGAIYLSGDTLNLNNSTLTLNNATNGGAIYISGGTLNLNNTQVTQNNATNGGAVYNDGTSTVNGGDFIGNTATYGGAIYNNAPLNVTCITFINNTASDGGAIYNDASLNITSSTLNNNTATDGGALWNNQGGLCTVESSSFTRNNASEGGAIYNIGGGAGDAIVNLNNSTLTQNTATDNGGAIYNIGITSNNYYGTGIVNITNSILTQNIATDNGGVIYNNIMGGYSTVNITNSTLTQNTATNLYGGAIYNYGSCAVNGSTLNNNTAIMGGAIYNHVGPLNINDSTLTQNNAFLDGGAIYNENNGIANITNTTFTGNIAKAYGGAICNMGNTYGSPTVNINGSTLTQNNAFLDGGAIYNDGSNGTAIVNINGSTLTQNTATNGGVIYNYNDGGTATVDLNFNRIVYNTATGQGNVIYNLGDTIDATLNWWGSNNPVFNILITGTGTVNVKPYLVLNITANPTFIYYGGNSTVNCYLLNDSNGNYHDPSDGCVPGVLVTFTSTLGNMNPTDGTLSDGTSQSTFTPNNIGTATITATIDDQTVSTSIQINTSPTNLTMTNVHNFAGQNVTLIANVTDYYGNPVNGGQVAFSVNHTAAGTVSVVDGVATTTWQIPSNWSVGTYPVIIASYSGGGTNYLNSINSSILTVDPTPTNVNVTSVHNFAGQTVTLTANVKDYYNNPVNSGQVTFIINGVNAGPVNVNNGVATLNNWTIPSSWNAWVYTITANYLGTSNYTTSTGSGNLTVDQAPTHITVPHIDNFAGQNVTLIAEVYDYYGNPVNEGQITFTIGNATPITVPVINGAATTAWQIPSNWSAGHYTITANYNETTNYLSSQGLGDLRVDSTPTNTTVPHTDNFTGQNVTLTAQVADYYGNPVNEGRVQFKVNGNNVGGQVSVNNGTATYTYTITGLNSGNYTILANYLGTSNYIASNNTGNLTVDPTPTNVTVNNEDGYAGQNVKLTAQVTDAYGNPVNNGQVTFTINGTNQGTVPVINGIATTTWLIPSWNIGNYTILANYDGTTTNNANSNGTGTLTVDQTPTNTTVNSVHGYAGQNVTLTAQVTNTYGNPVNNGQVTFTINGTNQGTVPVINGAATTTWQIPSNWNIGNYTILANYDGTTTNNANSTNAT